MDLKRLLEERDAKEKQPFENLIYTINEYTSELESALILVDSLRTSLRRNRFSHREDSIGGSSSNSSVLEAKLKELKEERAELYRQQGTQATHLLTLNDQLRTKDALITTLNTEITYLKQSQERKDEEVKKLKEKVNEGEEGAKIIGDELVALQLELLRLDQWQNQKTKNTCHTEDYKESNIVNNNNDKDAIINLDLQTNTLKLVKEKEITAPHQYPISSYTSKPNSRQLLTGSEDQKIVLYDLTRISTKMVLKWSKMNGPIVSLAVEDGIVASCSAYDKEVTIWAVNSGKIQGTLQFTDDSSEVPLLRFGPHSRLWMSLGRSVRLWDVQRGLLLRSWNRDLIPNAIQNIQVDQKRPDRLWCFDMTGSFTILNAVTGKLEVPWKPINNEVTSGIHYDSSMELALMSRPIADSTNWIITGYSRNATGLDGVFEFNLHSDFITSASDKDNIENIELKSISVHPERSDLISLILNDRVLFIKVSRDHWKPEIVSLECEDCDTVQWGPCEDDPINGEKGCKVVLIGKESKRMQLHTLSRI